jgi:hypothetical protein
MADAKAALEKYRATPQFKQALDVIDPVERQAECEHQIATALFGIEIAAKIDRGEFSVRTLAQHKKLLKQLAGRLEADIKLASQAVPLEYQIWRGKDAWIGDHLKRHLEETEQAINWVSERVRKGSPRVSHARRAAVDSAYFLLGRYGKRPLGLSREGPWHKLAKALLGKDETDATDLFKVLKWRLDVQDISRLTTPPSESAGDATDAGALPPGDFKI